MSSGYIPLKAKSAATELYCAKCTKRYNLDTVINLCSCGKPLLVDYDYRLVSKLITPDELSKRTPSVWKYRELLPLQRAENIISLGEGGSPLHRSRYLGAQLGLENIFLKDETLNPGGSFKARGMTVAVSRAVELGLDKLIVPSAGNAGSALAAYSNRAGLKAKVIMPADVPKPFQIECKLFSAEVELVDGTIRDCGTRVKELVDVESWFSVATLIEPYRIEGKKTMGYELWEQFGYSLPDFIFYPTGGGTGLIGMWKAFDELESLGWIGSERPHMVSVQAEGCAPIVKAYKKGEREAEMWDNPKTEAAGLRVPGAIGDFLILDAVYKSKGTAIAVSEEGIRRGTKALCEGEAVFSSPEGGAVVEALRLLKQKGVVASKDKIVLFITGSGYKYLDILSAY